MNKNKERTKVERLEDILKKLYSEYIDIKVKIKGGNITVIFMKTKKKIWRILIPTLATTKNSLYELLVTSVPKQLSYRKAKNYSFSTMYLLQIAIVLDKGPQFIIDFLEDKLRELPESSKVQLTDILEETKNIQSQGLEDSKLCGGLIKVYGNDDILNQISKLLTIV